MDLTTLADLKAWLNISSTTDDALLTRLITAVSGWVARYLNRSLGSASYDEFYDGSGGQLLVLRQFPVTAVALVAVDTITIPPAPDTVSPGWRLVPPAPDLSGPGQPGQLILSGYVFHRGLGNVEVKYTAGYSSVPGELEQAAIELCALGYAGRTRIGESSKALPGGLGTVAYLKDIPPGIMQVLNRYKRVAPI